MVASIAIMLAIYSFTESRMLEIYYNFVYFYILADYCVPCVLHDENYQQEAYRLIQCQQNLNNLCFRLMERK